MINKWQPQTADEILRRFESDIFPAFGHLPIAEVQAPDVFDAVRAIERRGALEIANRQTAVPVRAGQHMVSGADLDNPRSGSTLSDEHDLPSVARLS
jgi:hypothetical protein